MHTVSQFMQIWDAHNINTARIELSRIFQCLPRFWQRELLPGSTKYVYICEVTACCSCSSGRYVYVRKYQVYITHMHVSCIYACSMEAQTQNSDTISFWDFSNLMHAGVRTYRPKFTTLTEKRLRHLCILKVPRTDFVSDTRYDKSTFSIAYVRINIYICGPGELTFICIPRFLIT